jgi:transcriptional regulator with XRE-family HTH domain
VAYTKPDPPFAKIGARLALTRRALTLTRFQMARVLGTDMPTWGTYEAGINRIPPDQALKLSAYGIPLDWVYRGHDRPAPAHPRQNSPARTLTEREGGR